MILAGDIGGTKAHLGLFEPPRGPRHPVRDRRFATEDHLSLDSVVRAFLDGAPGRSDERPTRAVFGIAGPIQGNRVETTNLPWTIDGDDLERLIGAPVSLLNDLEATAWGLVALGDEDLELLHRGRAAVGNRALIAAGTGLGESVVARLDGHWLPLPSEGGHSDFAPRDDFELELFDWLRGRYGHVSYERILSGAGMADLYRFLTETGRGEEPPEVARRMAAAPDPAVLVTETGVDGSCPRARMALERMIAVYGAEAGNLALKALALGGVFVGGGIAPRLLPVLREGGFVAAFQDKGRLRPLLDQIPIAVIKDSRTALWGAAAYAMTAPIPAA